MGARLAMTTGTMPNDPSSVLVTSFVHGLELVRRGLVCEVSLPAIFLADDDWQTLEITPVADSSGDCLIAVYRTEESGRIAPFLEVGTWRRIVSKKALVEG